MKEHREVVVVGAGPAGTATATLLARRGHDVLLLDESTFPRDKICGEALSPGAWPVLEALGAVDTVTGLGPRLIRGMRLSSPDGSGFVGRYPADRAPGLAVRRMLLDHALLDLAGRSGVEVRQGHRVTALLRAAGDSGAVTGVVSESQGVRQEWGARVVVGADGRRSVVARKLGLLREAARRQRFAVRGHWSGMQGLEDLGEMHVRGRAYCGVAPLPEGLANVTFVVDAREMKATRGDNLEAFYRRRLRTGWPELAERLAAACLVAAPRAIGPLTLECSRAAFPGGLLVGDSAGFFDPFTGEGMTLALRSAEMAARAAHQSLVGTPSGLAAYEVERTAATRGKFLFNRLVQRVVSWPGLANHVARRLGTRPALADRFVQIAGDHLPARSAVDLPTLWALLAGR